MLAAVRLVLRDRIPLGVGVFALTLAVGGRLLGGSQAFAAADPEVEIKVAMIYNIARFVEWPPGRSPSATPGSLFRLGVEGDDELFAAFLTLAGRTVGGANIEIVPVRTNADLQSCHLVYFATGRATHVASTADATLTVSDTAGFCRAGGVVELVRERNKIRFLVNPDAARANGLQLSSQFLKLATIVESD